MRLVIDFYYNTNIVPLIPVIYLKMTVVEWETVSNNRDSSLQIFTIIREKK
jgi:hypothetical protein